MNTLIFPTTNDFQLNYHSKSLFPGFENHPDFDESSLLSNGSSSPVDGSSSEGEISKDFSIPRTEPSPGDESEGEIFKENDHSNAMMTFISQMLMEEEDLENTPDMLHDSLALQATEKSLYDVLYTNNFNQNADSSNSQSRGSSSDVGCFAEPNWNQGKDFESLLISSSQVRNTAFPVIPSDLQSSLIPFRSSNSLSLKQPEFESNGRNVREKKNRQSQDGDLIEEKRCNKQLANNNVGEFEPPELFDKVLLCSKLELAGAMPPCGEIEAKKQMHQNEQPKGSSNRGRPKGGNKKQGIVKKVVDLRSLLMNCAQAMASYDSRTVNDLLKQIRHHSSPHGDGAERVAHYFANAIEARLTGTRSSSYAGTSYHGFAKMISAADILKAYQTFIIACPFRKMSNVIANKTIKKLATGSKTLHVIDFGILYGYQWPCLIQALSEMPDGPPKLRMTGIDFPQPGFRPAERVEESGNRLKKYCERFGVPFEYTAIAQKWETVKVEDLKIEKNETLVVNSLYRLDNVPDETVTVNRPRDAVLNLIRKINPNLFILGILNGTYNTPFFVTRFREALFHFSAMFDMFEATTPRDDKHRVMFEQEILGKDAMNVIACEGTERVNRPETYKQWQVQIKRASFRQVALDQELVKYVRYRVKGGYNKDFSVDEDGKWMLQGWKGRVIHALSFWQPE